METTPIETTFVSRQPYESFVHISLGRKSFVTLSYMIDQNYVRVGVACCCSKDRFTKSIGRRIAQGRRDKSNCLAFEFERNDQKIRDQLQVEFEAFVISDHNDMTANEYGDLVRAPALPPWVYYNVMKLRRQRENQPQ